MCCNLQLYSATDNKKAKFLNPTKKRILFNHHRKRLYNYFQNREISQIRKFQLESFYFKNFWQKRNS
jgi:hypothetical protein